MDGGSSDLPKSILYFRKLLNHVKRRLLDGDPSAKANIQSISNLTRTVERIRQFGNIVIAILEGSDIDQNEYTTVRKFFRNNDFDFSKLSPEERELCIHYVDNDVKMFPYDLNPSHIDAVQKYQ